jgi:hypothetical protein
MANSMATMQGCCCSVIINNCTEFWDYLATKTEIEVTLASELVGGGYFDCTDADCQAIIDGTYVLTKIAGSFAGSGSCVTAGSGRTFTYTFSENIDCVAGGSPYTGIAVDFVCTGTGIQMRCLYRKAPSGVVSCSEAYGHFGGVEIAFPADFSAGTLPDAGPGSFSNPCVPTAADMPFAFL